MKFGGYFFLGGGGFNAYYVTWCLNHSTPKLSQKLSTWIVMNCYIVTLLLSRN